MKYIFRGVVVFDYDPKTKQMTAPDKDGEGFNFCRWVPEDYLLMSKFFHLCHEHSIGTVHESFLKDVVVA